MTNVEKLNAKLEEVGGTVRGVFPGTNPNATAEDVAGEILRSIERLERGEFEFVADIG